VQVKTTDYSIYLVKSLLKDSWLLTLCYRVGLDFQSLTVLGKKDSFLVMVSHDGLWKEFCPYFWRSNFQLDDLI